ncbi:MAG: putative Co/Zn/Cd efflux system rane fusion protein [Labilithrix sp.]|nr:putative Co/Zn/Cd efflux system rane fusion protein [Labilithrix sp.]
MKNATRVILAVVGILVVGGLILFMRGRSASAQAKGAGGPAGSASAGGDRVIPVATAVVTKKDVPVIIEGLGTVTPIAQVTQKSQVDGRLDSVLFTEGKPVKKGDVLALVDPRPFAIQLHTAEAALYRDDAQLRNGKLNLERYETLRKQNLIPQQQVDDQRTAVDQLEAASRTDRAQIESARLNLDYARITSPIDGVTGIRQVDPGNLVHAADANGIVVITQIDPIAVLFTVPQDELPRVQRALAGGKVVVEVYGRDGAKKLSTGELLLVDNQVNAQTATIRLKASFPNPDHALWPNAFVKARMQLEMLKDALVVPASVVQRGPNGTFAYVMAPDHSVAPRNVEVGTIEGDVATIAKGLAENDVVVTDGQNQLKPGSKVSPRGPGGGAPAGSASAGPAGSGRGMNPATGGAHP